MNTPESNKSAVEKFFSTLNKSEHIALSDSYFHKDHKFHFPLFQEPLNVEGHKKMDEEFIKGFPDTQIIVDDLFAADSKVVLRGKFAGTHKGEFNKIPPTGNKVNLPFISIVKFQDGKNIEEWVEMDTTTLMKQLGLIPEQS